MSLSDLRKNTRDIFIHAVIAIVVSSAIYLKSGNFLYAGIFACGGILIDLDHFIDYFIYFKNRFNLKDFLIGSYFRSGRVYLVLHSWEIVFIIFTVSFLNHSRELSVLAVGMAAHLLVDNLQRENRLAYFLIYRMMKRFNARILFPESSFFANKS